MKDYRYDYEWDENYCYPESNVLINKLNIKNADALFVAEREITALKIAKAKDDQIKGNFDLKHLQKIHKYIFEDIYTWAGKLRTVNIAKGNQFCLSMWITLFLSTKTFKESFVFTRCNLLAPQERWL